MISSKSLFVILLVFGIGGLAAKTQLPRLVVNFEWSKENLCQNGISPELKIQGIPIETTKLKWNLTDLQAPAYNHGGGTLVYLGTNTIPKGTLIGYNGPCPPMNSPHVYKFSIKALDAEGKVIAFGTGKRRCNRWQLRH